MRGELTLREIQEQPAAWAAVLEQYAQDGDRVLEIFDARSPRDVVFTGCGSSYYLSLAAAAVFRAVTGRDARAVPASEILQFPDSAFTRAGTSLLVAASRSGTTSETLRAAQVAARRRIGVIALTCAGRSPLARAADLALVAPLGRERSVVMTKSFSSMLLLGLLLAQQLADDAGLRRELRRLPALGRRVLKVAPALTRDLGVAAARFVFLGAGPAHGIAWEAMLKITEMAQRHAVAYHPLEFRHGPIAMAGPDTLVTLFGTDAGTRLEQALVQDLATRGAHVLALSDTGRPGAEIDVTLGAGVSDTARLLLYLPFGQTLAYHRAVHASLNPDRPRHLTAVVRL